MSEYWNLSLTDDDAMGAQAARNAGWLPPEPAFPETMKALDIDPWESPANVQQGISSVSGTPFVNPVGAAPAPGVQAAPAFVGEAQVVPPAYQHLTRTPAPVAESIIPPDSRTSIQKGLDLLKGLPLAGPIAMTPGGAYQRQGKVEDLATAYNTDIPIYSDFARSTIQPALGTLGELAGAGLDRKMGGLSEVLNQWAGTPTLAQTGRFVGETFAPVTAGDVALGAATGNVTGVDDLLRSAATSAVKGYADNALRAGLGAVPPGAVRSLDVPPALLRTEGTNIPRLVSPTAGEGVVPIRGASDEIPRISPSTAGSEASPAGLTGAASAPPAGSTPSGAGVSGGVSLYHEGDANDLFDVLPRSGRIGSSSRDWWFAEDADLALGQGKRRGVVIEFDPSSTTVTPKASKPAAGFVGPEYYSELAPSRTNAVIRSVTVRADSNLDRVEQTRLRTYMQREGWDRTRNADGSTTYRPPSGAAAGGEVSAEARRGSDVVRQQQATEANMRYAIARDRLFAARGAEADRIAGEIATATPDGPEILTRLKAQIEAAPGDLPDVRAAIDNVLAPSPASVPTAEPPMPPRGATPAPPSSPAGGGDPVKKLTGIIDQARPLPAQTEAVRSAERAQRVAASASILERGGRTPDAYQAARGALGGEYSRAAFDPPAANFAPEEVAQLRTQLADAGLRHFEEINAEQALSKVLDGRLNEIRNFELELLDRVYGSDLSLAVAGKAMPPSFGDKAFEFWISNILSGPITNARNFVGNSASALASPVERFGAAALEQPISRIQGRAAERFFAEVPAEVFGMARGVPEGTRAALRTIKNGWGQSALTEAARGPAIGGKLGRVIRTPLTALEAMDGFFRAINFEGAKSALAVREAKMAGLKGDALSARIAELIANPSDDLLEKATQASLYRLFRDEPTRYGQAVMAARDKAPALRFIIPFARTPDRLIAYGVKRSPLGLLDTGMWTRLAAKNPSAVDELAQTLIGSTVAMGLGTMVANGTIEITGATPDDRAERDRFYREGKLPFSVKLPGIGWVQYSQIPGLDTTLSTVAAAQSAYKSGGKVDEFAAQLGATVAQNLWDKSYVSGLADFMDIFGHGYTDPVDSAKRWAARNVSGFVPFSAAIRQTEQMFDQTIRDPKTFTEQVAVGVGINDAVPPKLNAFGEESKRAFPSPISTSSDKTTAVDAELERLGEEVTFVGTLKGASREEQLAYQQMAGQMHKFLLERAISDDRYAALPDSGKVKVIESLVTNARGPVRDVLDALRSSEGYQAASDADKQEMLRRAAEKWLAKIEERR